MEQEFWEKRYEDQETQWDMGSISTPLKAYIDQLEDKSISILIPGCGFGHEAAYLHQQSFTNVTVLDFSASALEEFMKNNPDFPKNQCVQSDFFEHKGNYDLILEQTFFCAINPSMRKRYAQHMFDLLDSSGKLVGLLFDFPLDPESGPPFGGSKEEYLELFGEHFKNISIEKCYNSIPPRAGREFFVNLSKISNE